MRLHRFALPKSDGCPQEYEDAAWPDVDETLLDTQRVRVAVADGASESLLSGAWARLLATAACRFDPRALRQAIRWAAARWPDETADWLRVRERPWWQIDKLGRGAHATVLVAQVRGDGQWRAAAVGDSCLLHLRGGRLIRAFPLADAAAFDSRPDLVNSAAAGSCRPLHASGTYLPGDRLLLATDAVANWLLHAPERPSCLLAELARGGPDAFAAWAAGARRAGTLRDDDLTLLILDD